MNKIIIDTNKKTGKIDKNIYGHFAEHLGHCIYEGIWVGKDSDIPNTEGFRNDVIETLKELEIPVLRWPGGCFADEYHWRDGIGPYENRKRMINTHWGGVLENNHFGTHEFLKFCELIETEPYICGNVGSGSVQEMSEWVEYMTFDGESPLTNERKANGQEKAWKMKYFGVGNENWGCGGNMRPEYYADLYNNYATYVRDYDENNKLLKIAGGPNVDDFAWTEACMKIIKKEIMWGLSVHNYTFTCCWEKKGNATDFDDKDWFTLFYNALKMDDLIVRHSKIMDKYDPEKQVAIVVDEWGTWFNVKKDTNPGFLNQQNTIRDAIVAAIHFNIFHKHCERVKMANIAQMVNVLQAIILTEESKMIKTPTYHVFDMYKVHKEAENIDLKIKCGKIKKDKISLPALHATASINKDGIIHISAANLDSKNPQTAVCSLKNLTSSTTVSGTILTADEMDAHNDFDNPEKVVPADFKGFTVENGKLKLELPPMSIITVAVKM